MITVAGMFLLVFGLLLMMRTQRHARLQGFATVIWLGTLPPLYMARFNHKSDAFAVAIFVGVIALVMVVRQRDELRKRFTAPR